MVPTTLASLISAGTGVLSIAISPASSIYVSTFVQSFSSPSFIRSYMSFFARLLSLRSIWLSKEVIAYVAPTPPIVKNIPLLLKAAVSAEINPPP